MYYFIKFIIQLNYETQNLSIKYKCILSLIVTIINGLLK